LLLQEIPVPVKKWAHFPRKLKAGKLTDRTVNEKSPPARYGSNG
jgi:hypothetical protein